jgi:predicted transcriptional regulator
MEKANPNNLVRVQYWSQHYLPELVARIQEAAGNKDDEWIVRNLLSLMHDIQEQLGYALNVGKFDDYSEPKR